MTSADELQNSVNRLKNKRNAMQSREILKGGETFKKVQINLTKLKNALNLKI
jgi:flagellin-specific chaperone FliS